MSPDGILRDLARLWQDLGAGHEGGSDGVLRACAMTLIVFDHGEEVNDTLAALMPEHPARAIVVRVAAAGPPAFEARVSADCRRPFGQRRQICCERIEIETSEAALPDLPAFLLPLAAPDLPVMLWFRNPRLFASPHYEALSALAAKVIADSGPLPGGLRLMRERARVGPVLADLAWTRLTRWRALVSQMFENRAHLEQLPRVNELRITRAGAASWYLAAWLLESVPDARVVFEDPDPQLRRVALLGPGLEFSITAGGDGCAEILTPSGAQRTSLPAPSEYLLLREELGIASRDPVFEKTLEAALRLMYLHTE
ncbi:MAG: glucose-6-phosphate dehydrogenase assembly protein OpcA [Bryobacteraceae bacterium]